ncbi:sulfatase-like hydrolase/transferase [Paenibacillus sp. IITD108]|uniref:sulfatase-like hydrolase/transferase n=1 Tax=Paenibacillus sp. IITD108 TaxID=3116649 RepID=UPI002F42CF6E
MVNVLLIMSDEHRRDAMGCMGHSVVKTPNLDRLAQNGSLFTSAYCNSPLCGPSRSSFITGKYVHEIGCWDQNHHYTGEPQSWGAYLKEHRVSVTTVGKLDFFEGVEGGFSDQRLVKHRRKMQQQQVQVEAKLDHAAGKQAARSFGSIELERSGPGDYWTKSVEAETAAALRFLRNEAPGKETPWVLWLNYLPPHFPLVAPASYYAMYPTEQIDMPYDHPTSDNHPVTAQLREHIGMNEVDEEMVRRARAAYYGLCSYIDDHIDKVLQALEEVGLIEDTLIIYTSDHGEHLGDHELWWKNHLYEQAAGIPLIISGGGVSRNIVNTPVSLLDLSATIVDAVGLPPFSVGRGRSLLPLCQGEYSKEWAERAVFSEYHGHGTTNSMYMIRKGKYKYIYYPNNPPQLFNLETDQREMTNLAEQQSCRDIVQQLHSELLNILDPDLVDEFVRRTCKSESSGSGEGSWLE